MISWANVNMFLPKTVAKSALLKFISKMKYVVPALSAAPGPLRFSRNQSRLLWRDEELFMSMEFE